MITPLVVGEFLAGNVPVVDVRSPGEFRQGHIPGAHNLPLFDNAERAVVGTLYKQQGRDQAVLEGLRIVGPKLAGIVETCQGLAPDGHIRVHCWRGGERSGSVAWLLDKAGFARVDVLRGGYKAFRNLVLESFNSPPPLKVLGGYTGTGKTETLDLLRAQGEQVIDLEGLAHHKGSSFGALGELPQPSTEHFENLLWKAVQDLSRTRPTWVEDESLMIGRVRIPGPFFEAMRRSTLYFADMPIEERADRLVVDYGRFPKEELAEAVRRIEKRLGPQHCKAALEALEQGDLRTVALITLHYYDKSYRRGLEGRDPGQVVRIPAAAHDLRGLAARLAAHVTDPAPHP